MNGPLHLKSYGRQTNLMDIKSNYIWTGSISRSYSEACCWGGLWCNVCGRKTGTNCGSEEEGSRRGGCTDRGRLCQWVMDAQDLWDRNRVWGPSILVLYIDWRTLWCLLKMSQVFWLIRHWPSSITGPNIKDLEVAYIDFLPFSWGWIKLTNWISLFFWGTIIVFILYGMWKNT